MTSDKLIGFFLIILPNIKFSLFGWVYITYISFEDDFSILYAEVKYSYKMNWV